MRMSVTMVLTSKRNESSLWEADQVWSRIPRSDGSRYFVLHLIHIDVKDVNDYDYDSYIQM